MRLPQIMQLVLLIWAFLLPSCLLDSTIDCNEFVCGQGGQTAGSGGQPTAGNGGQGGQPNGGAGGVAGGDPGGQGGGGTQSGGNGGFGGAGNGGGGAGPTCGNDIKEIGETCDGTDLDSQDCGTVPGGFTGGTLTCEPDCSAFNTSACLSPPLTCLAGSAGTVDNITASGAIETGYLLHHGDGTEFYSALVPTMDAFNGEDLPGQLALYGKEGIQFDLQNGLNPVAMPFYEVDDFSSLPSPECDGVGFKTQACLSLVAKSFRCQYAPYNEAFGCPLPVSFFEPLESPSDFYQDLTAGHHLLVVDLTCP
jgi:hypothetical protein